MTALRQGLISWLGAITGGRVRVNGIESEFLKSFLDILSEMGLSVNAGPGFVEVARDRDPPVKVVMGPFPEMPTDLQAPLMALLTTAGGSSTLEETVYEGRFGHISELSCMGAKIRIMDHIVTIEGVPKLTGAPVDGLDIRAAASLSLAALAAEGTTQLHEAHHTTVVATSFLNRS